MAEEEEIAVETSQEDDEGLVSLSDDELREITGGIEVAGEGIPIFG